MFLFSLHIGHYLHRGYMKLLCVFSWSTDISSREACMFGPSGLLGRRNLDIFLFETLYDWVNVLSLYACIVRVYSPFLRYAFSVDLLINLIPYYLLIQFVSFFFFFSSDWEVRSVIVITPFSLILHSSNFFPCLTLFLSKNNGSS